ncbi:MAG: aromatic ring-hydroxylating dioxygenase subunit alpha [Betaproteobacteria bacterium]|jgi:choline monooxygenase|nr:aromatic ring-hydroxylating dioxygenase subunit alpha [Betaproteobacteria bacterium]MCC6248239.1 aromatic ring-hydroxylating dioxygenase subunit alpha [Rubrivivax sp.]
MSDLSIPLDARAKAQLPVHSYFEEGLFRQEQEKIFQLAPAYLGHELAVPEVGDYLALPQEAEGRALVRHAPGPDGISLLSNVCRHRQAVMLRGRGQSPGGSHIVCPLHRWTYALDGKLAGAPHFAEDPCLNLRQYPLQRWNGLIFEGKERSVPAELAALDAKSTGMLDFSGYVYDRAQLHECNYNWKTFIEVYLEDYHVGPFHPGLGHFVTCDDLRWTFGRNHSLQTVGIHQALNKPGSQVYERWHAALMKYRQGVPPTHGAVWLTMYPTTMVEWYPHVLVVSTLFPRGPRKTLNLVEFFYPEEIVAFEREFVEAQQAAYMETCIEDDEIGERMDEGRAALLARGENEVGPYQSPMEDGMLHFHEWYRREMGLAAEGTF